MRAAAQARLVARQPWPGATSASQAELFDEVRRRVPAWGYGELRAFLGELEQTAEGDDGRERALTVLTLLMDRRCPLGAMKRSCLLSVLDACLERVVEALRQAPSPRYALCGCGERADISGLDVTLVFDARGFTSEGDAALSRALVDACWQGVRRFIVANCRGQCFIGCGLGPASHGVRIDVYGASCDYLASGIDSAEIRGARHGAGPGRPDHEGRPTGDHGDVGQAFMAGDP